MGAPPSIQRIGLVGPSFLDKALRYGEGIQPYPF